MVFKRGRRLPAVPPVPEAIQARQDQQVLQDAQNLLATIHREVLPRINRLLGSEGSNSYDIGSLNIMGSSSMGVRIYNTTGALGWLSPLLAALRGPAYRGYTVTAAVEWREGGGRAPRWRSLPLNESDPSVSIVEAKKRNNQRSVRVAVRIKVPR